MVQIAIFLTPFVILIGLAAWYFRAHSHLLSTSDPFPKARRVWKVASGLICGAGMLAMFATVYLWYDYQQSKPKAAQPSIGRVHAEQMRGVTVYLTSAEKARFDLCRNASFACVLAWFIVMGIMQREQQRVDDRRLTRPGR